MPHRPIVIVTGASRGIGAAVARRLGESGAGVTLLARSEPRLEAAADAVRAAGGLAETVVGDVSDPEVCRETVERTLDRFGRIDGLVNNAGVIEPLSVTGVADLSRWRYNLEVNVYGPFALMRYASEALRKRHGRVVNVSSGAASRPIPAAGAYCAAKAALTHLTRVFAEEEPAVTALCVRPGVVDTAMQAVLRRQGPEHMPPEDAAFYQQLHEEGRLEPPEVPGRAIAWLVLHAPKEWSGSFLDYDDPMIAAPAAQPSW
ncbi:MAG: SDR family NAD(P)-dependent oxidoreductase [Desulfobacteraceae bacterium]|nr:SDR family NAD(P)-dependent oxidoreductase [Desulfobacteraceae bacterium]